MTGPVILLMVSLVFLVWAGVIVVQWRVAAKLQREVYQKYREDGTLAAGVDEAEFARVFLRCEGPRFATHLFAGALSAPFLIMFSVGLFNAIWDMVWDRTGQVGWFDVGELPHSLMTVFLYVSVLFLIAWFVMRRYHVNAPGSLRKEMRRLNGEDG